MVIYVLWRISVVSSDPTLHDPFSWILRNIFEAIYSPQHSIKSICRVLLKNVLLLPSDLHCEDISAHSSARRFISFLKLAKFEDTRRGHDVSSDLVETFLETLHRKILELCARVLFTRSPGNLNGSMK